MKKYLITKKIAITYTFEMLAHDKAEAEALAEDVGVNDGVEGGIKHRMTETTWKAKLIKEVKS